MKIPISKIPQDGTLHVEGDLDAAILELDPAEGAPLSPIHCALDVGLSGSGLFAVGSLSVQLRLRCVACLRDFEMDLALGDYALQIERNGAEFVDLTEEIREDILLRLPSHPRCDADGSRECPARFQDAPGAPLSEEPDAASSAWNALDQIKPKK